MVLEHFLNKLTVVLSTVWGWLLAIFLVIANFLAGYETMVGFTVAAVLMDAAWGIASSLKQKRFTKSELARDSFSKLAVYGSVIVLSSSLTSSSGRATDSPQVPSAFASSSWSYGAHPQVC